MKVIDVPGALALDDGSLIEAARLCYVHGHQRAFSIWLLVSYQQLFDATRLARRIEEGGAQHSPIHLMRFEVKPCIYFAPDEWAVMGDHVYVQSRPCWVSDLPAGIAGEDIHCGDAVMTRDGTLYRYAP